MFSENPLHARHQPLRSTHSYDLIYMMHYLTMGISPAINPDAKFVDISLIAISHPLALTWYSNCEL